MPLGGFTRDMHRFDASRFTGRAAAMRYSKRADGYLYVDEQSKGLRRGGARDDEVLPEHEPWTEVINYQPPSVDSSVPEVEESTRVYQDSPPQSFVISGPLGNFPGPGRRFPSVRDAQAWVVEYYGGFIARIYEAEPGGRWAFRVKPRVLQAPGSGAV